MSTTTPITREAVEARVLAALEVFGAEPSELGPDASFEALDVDSLDLVELAQIVQEEYGVELKGAALTELKTVRDAVDAVVARTG